MAHKHYIFLTMEGHTYQPGSEAISPDVDNVQMLGIATGPSQRVAFRRLIATNSWLEKTTFDEVYCYELASGYAASRTEFSLEAECRRTKGGA